MKINRLLEITMILLSKRQVTAAELAQRFEVSVRTIYRDIDEMSMAGVPVYANRGAGGGIALLPGYTINKALLSKSESDGVLLALRTLQATRYPDAESALEKISAVFNVRRSDSDTQKETDWIDIHFQPWQSDPNENERFAAIKTAAMERRVIEFDYINVQGECGRRAVEPQKLIYNGHSFYLFAFCRKRCENRMFRVTRMKNITVTNEHFVPHVSLPKTDHMSEDGRPEVLLRLKFQAKVLHRIYDYFSDEIITRNSDGSCTVEVNWPEDEWVYGYILSFGDACEVIEPLHIRKIIASRLKSALKAYENDLV